MLGPDALDNLETIDFTVYGSSLHLFKNIKASLRRCLSFSKGKALYNLQIAFKTVFAHFVQNLKRKLPQRAFEEQNLLNGTASPLVLSDDDETKCVYLVNTAEYCLETIP